MIPSKIIRRFALISFVLAALAGGIYLEMLFLQRKSPPATRLIQVVHLEAIGRLLGEFAEKNDGMLPQRLEDLIPEDPGRNKLLTFVNPTTYEKSPWIYYGAGKSLEHLAPEDVLVASRPFHEGKKGIALQMNAKWEVIEAPVAEGK
jgi:hypothetical protein